MVNIMETRESVIDRPFGHTIEWPTRKDVAANDRCELAKAILENTIQKLIDLGVYVKVGVPNNRKSAQNCPILTKDNLLFYHAEKG